MDHMKANMAAPERQMGVTPLEEVMWKAVLEEVG